MAKRKNRYVAVALVAVCLAAHKADVARAAPVAVRMAHSGIAVMAARPSARVFVGSGPRAFQPVFRTAAAAAPIAALPLGAFQRPAKMQPLVWLSSALAAATTPVDATRCGVPDHPVLISRLPLTVFGPRSCASADERDVARSFEPGRNKNALSARKYSSFAEASSEEASP